MQGLNGVYKILYPFNQIGHVWEKNPSLIEAPWINNWHKYIQDENDENLPQHIKEKQQDKELKEYADKELQSLMDNFDSYRNESTQRKEKQVAKQAVELNGEEIDVLAEEAKEIEAYKKFMDIQNKIPQNVDSIKDASPAIPVVPVVVEEVKEIDDETQELFAEQIAHGGHVAAAEAVLIGELFDSIMANPPVAQTRSSLVVSEKKKKKKRFKKSPNLGALFMDIPFWLQRNKRG